MQPTPMGPMFYRSQQGKRAAIRRKKSNKMQHCAKQVNKSIDGISTVIISGKALEIDVANLVLARGNSTCFFNLKFCDFAQRLDVIF